MQHRKNAIQRIFTLSDYLRKHAGRSGYLLYRDRDVSAQLWWIKPGSFHLDVHKHSYSAHVYTVLQGRGEVLLGKGTWAKIRMGQVIVNPRNKVHGIRNTSKSQRLVWMSVTASGDGPFQSIPSSEDDD